MKKVIFVLGIILFITACKKSTDGSSETVNNPEWINIQGKWILSDVYVSPGGGVNLQAIPWSPVGASNSDYLWFMDDHSGRFRISGTVTSFVYSIYDSSLVLTKDNQELVLGYKVDKPHLEIYGNLSFEAHCIEFCGTRYILFAAK